MMNSLAIKIIGLRNALRVIRAKETRPAVLAAINGVLESSRIPHIVETTACCDAAPEALKTTHDISGGEIRCTNCNEKWDIDDDADTTHEALVMCADCDAACDENDWHKHDGWLCRSCWAIRYPDQAREARREAAMGAR